MPRDNEIGAKQSASRCDEPSQDGGSDGKWWVCVGHDHGDRAPDEGLLRVAARLSVELHCNDLGTAFEDRPGERAIAGADIEYEIIPANSVVR